MAGPDDGRALQEKIEKARAWAQANPLLTGIIGIGGLFLFILLIVIISLFKSSGPSKSDVDAAQAEKNVCKRLTKLQQLESETKQRTFSPEYLKALQTAYRELTQAEPTADDTLALSSVIDECSGLDNADFAWLVNIDTRFRKGEWPAVPKEPPANENVRARLYEGLARNPRLPIALPTEATVRDKWLRFAVENPEYAKNTAAPVGPLLAIFYKENDTPDAHVALYQQLAQMQTNSGWLARKLYDRLGLLPEPLLVADTAPETPPPGLTRGPEDTLRFLGVLAGERCAIAIDSSPLPPIWVRPCKGLKPRRFGAGELFLLSAEAQADVQFPLHWLPLLVEDSGEARYGEALRGKIDDRVLAAFMVAAPRFVLGPKGLLPFAPAPSVTQAHQGGAPFASFKTPLQGALRPRVLAFSAQAKVKLDKACPKVDKTRCDAVKGDGERDSCELAPPMCFTLAGAAMLRATPVRITRPLPCLKEYGTKTQCKAEEITGLFVDPIAEGSSEYTAGPFITLFEHKPEAGVPGIED